MTGGRDRRYWRGTLDVIATVAVIVASAAVGWAALRPRPTSENTGTARTRPEVTIPTEPIELAGAVTTGRADALVGLVGFSEFQCPYSAQFATETLPRLRQEYVDSGRVLLAFRQLPLERLHPFAREAAELAVCANESAQFWPVHDAFFAKPAVVAADEFRGRAIGAGMRPEQVEQCLKNGEAAQRVDADLLAARILKIQSTPVFLLGSVKDGRLTVRKAIRGAKPFSEFAEAIDAVLKSIEK